MKFFPLAGVIVGALPDLIRWARGGFSRRRPDSTATRL